METDYATSPIDGTDIYPFRGRTLNLGAPVEVYRNLRLGLKDLPVYSIRQWGAVVGHASRVILRDATFIVHEAGRQRVLLTGRKNVHAWVRGYLVLGTQHVDGDPVKYDPRRYAAFNVGGRRMVSSAKLVRIGRFGIIASDIA